MMRHGMLVALLVLAAAAPAAAKSRARVVKLTVGPFEIPAHRDREVCRAVRLPNVSGMEVASWEVRMRTSRGGLVGSHHFVAYAYQGSDSAAFPAANRLVDDPGCIGFGPSDFYRTRSFLGGSAGDTRRGAWAVSAGMLPGHLALRLPNPTDLPKDAVVVLNSHYFNYSARPGRGLVRMVLRLAPLDPTKRVVRMVNDSAASRPIRVAPLTSGDVSATWQADGRPNLDVEGGLNPGGDVCVLWLSSHMHKRGTLFTVDYEEEGQPVDHIFDTTDWVHPAITLLPRGGLLRAYTAENRWPRYRYGCRHANGVDGAPIKLGCEITPSVPPGTSWEESGDGLTSHAQPCVSDADCAGVGTGRCVPANLVFGPLSDDEMCILPAAIYDPKPGLPPDLACSPAA